MEFDVILKQKGSDVYVVTPVGAIDSTTYVRLDKEIEAVLDSALKAIILDLSMVNYISSMGIGVIVKTRRALAHMGSQLLLINLQPQVKKVFDIIKALPMAVMFSSVEEADAYLLKIQTDEIEKRRVAGSDYA
jgi:anti-sigma B factor antagonist